MKIIITEVKILDKGKLYTLKTTGEVGQVSWARLILGTNIPILTRTRSTSLTRTIRPETTETIVATDGGGNMAKIKLE